MKGSPEVPTPAQGDVQKATAEDHVAAVPRATVATAAVAVAVVSSFLFGYLICVLNTCLGLIAVKFQWCQNNWQSDCLASRLSQGMVNAAVYLGASVGALLVGRPQFARLGSRLQVCVADAFFVAGALACAVAEGVVVLILGRLLSGVGLGISAVAGPLYMAEVAPRERRGTNAAMHGVCITVGIFASIAFGIPQGPPPSGPEDVPMEELDAWFWRVLVVVPAPLALLQAFLFLVVVPIDPPSFLISTGRFDQARALLYRTYGEKDPDATAAASPSKSNELEMQLSEMALVAEEAAAAPRASVFRAFCDEWLRFAMILGFGLAALQQLCGINALMSYSNGLFQEAGVEPRNLTLASIAMAGANVCVSVCSSKFVDHWGRRRLLLMGCGVQAVAMMLLVSLLGDHGGSAEAAQVIGIVAVFCFSLFVTSFSAGLGAITWLYLSEIYPIEIRGPALSACGVVNWLCSFAVVFGSRLLSLAQACKLFGFICAVGFVLMYLFVVETKGCSLADSPVTPRSARTLSSLFNQSPKNDDEIYLGDFDAPQAEYRQLGDQPPQ